MIKFFRKIRQKLLSENKFSKYLIYAIGEIILVVIGILLALQINTLNDNQKKSSDEAKYLDRLHADIELQIGAINSQLRKEEEIIESSKFVLDELILPQERKTVFDNEFFDNLTSLSMRKTFRTIDATYTDLISTGELNIITNDSLKNDIVAYYQELERIESIIQNNNSDIIDKVILLELQGIFYYYRTNEYLKRFRTEDLSKYLGGFNSNDAAYASKLILEPQNNLKLKNIVRQRLLIAIYHKNSMKRLANYTETLSNRLTK